MQFSKFHSRDRSTACGKRHVLSGGYGQVLPDRYTCPEPWGLTEGANE